MQKLLPLVFGLMQPALAQPQCAPRAAILSALSQHFAETPRALGVAPGAVVELFTNPKTGTWTITATDPKGVTCLIASGADFQIIPQGKPI